jgi:hypothetical protein
MKDTLSSLPSRIGRRHVVSSVASAGRGLLSVEGIRSARLAKRMLLKSMLGDRKFLCKGWGGAVPERADLFQDGPVLAVRCWTIIFASMKGAQNTTSTTYFFLPDAGYEIGLIYPTKCSVPARPASSYRIGQEAAQIVREQRDPKSATLRQPRPVACGFARFSLWRVCSETASVSHIWNWRWEDQQPRSLAPRLG